MNSLLLTAILFAQPPDDLRGESKPSRPMMPVAVANEPPKLFVKSPTHPDFYLNLAIEHLTKLDEKDRIFTRFILFNTVPDALLADYVTLWRVYYNTLNPSSSLARIIEVVGSNGRMFAFDLRRTRWTVEAFTAVVRRDQTLREPHVDSVLAETLRKLIGVQQDIETFHVDAIAPGAWLMREVFEPGNRTTAMYDLLYSEERFGKTAFTYAKQVVGSPQPAGAVLTKKITKTREVFWKGGVWPNDGKFYPANAFKHLEEYEVDEPIAVAPSASYSLIGQQKVNTKLLKDFPADLTEFQDRWLITDAQKSLDKERIFAKRGEVVAGSKNLKNGGSIVSYNDRVIEILVLAGGFPSMRTRDFKKTSGKSNPANDPRGVAIGDLQEDAGEHLVTLPSGLQTAFLTGGAKDGRKRVEAGDAEVVHSGKDPSFGVVKTQFSCTICHAPTLGVIDPSNRKVTDAIRRGVRLLDKDIEVVDALAAFFTGWQEDTEVWRLPYKKALRELTTTPADLGWSGQKFATATIHFRDWYDAPVTLDQAAAELGVPKLALMFVLMAEGSIDSQNLFLGEAIPRAEWDDFLFRKLALALAAARNAESPNYFFKLFFHDLLRQTAEKVGKP